MPFVTRLAGTADKPEVELARAELIIMRTKLDILSLVTNAAAQAAAADAAGQAAAAYAAAAAASAVSAAVSAAAYAAYAAYAADAAASAVSSAYAAVSAAAYAADAADAEIIWTVAVTILDEAIRLGKQAEPIETALVAERMERAKVLVHG
jgi:hypothetical protein